MEFVSIKHLHEVVLTPYDDNEAYHMKLDAMERSDFRTWLKDIDEMYRTGKISKVEFQLLIVDGIKIFNVDDHELVDVFKLGVNYAADLRMSNNIVAFAISLDETNVIRTCLVQQVGDLTMALTDHRVASIISGEFTL